MANPSFKASAIERHLKDDIATRLPSLTVTEGFEATTLWPFVQVGSGSAGTASAYIQVADVTSIQHDVLGLAQNVFTPHVIRVCWEAVSGAGAYPLSEAQRAQILSEVVKMGTQVELYVTATGTGPSASGITAGNLKATFNTQVQYPLMADQ